MITFFACLVLLVVGFFTYGKLVEKVFRVDNRQTPCSGPSGRGGLCSHEDMENLFDPAVEHRGFGSHLRRAGGRVLGTCGLPLDCVRDHFWAAESMTSCPA